MFFMCLIKSECLFKEVNSSSRGLKTKTLNINVKWNGQHF